jgi:hypothetical protein
LGSVGCSHFVSRKATVPLLLTAKWSEILDFLLASITCPSLKMHPHGFSQEFKGRTKMLSGFRALPKIITQTGRCQKYSICGSGRQSFACPGAVNRNSLPAGILVRIPQQVIVLAMDAAAIHAATYAQ